MEIKGHTKHILPKQAQCRLEVDRKIGTVSGTGLALSTSMCLLVSYGPMGKYFCPTCDCLHKCCAVQGDNAQQVLISVAMVQHLSQRLGKHIHQIDDSRQMLLIQDFPSGEPLCLLHFGFAFSLIVETGATIMSLFQD